MKIIFSKTAISLIELIVATVLVAVVLLGIFSINMVINNNNQDFGQRFLVRSETQTTLNHILNNAFLAWTDPNNDPSFLIPTLADPTNNTFCIHQPPDKNQLDNSNIINSQNPAGIWLCYFSDGTQIQWCAENYNALPPNYGTSSCATAGANIIPFAGNNITFLGTAFSQFSILPPTHNNGMFNITIQNCLNNAAGSCKNTGVSTDLANNPEVQLSGSISTPQASS